MIRGRREKLSCEFDAGRRGKVKEAKEKRGGGLNAEFAEETQRTLRRKQAEACATGESLSVGHGDMVARGEGDG
jgi:hypothetical protein